MQDAQIGEVLYASLKQSKCRPCICTTSKQLYFLHVLEKPAWILGYFNAMILFVVRDVD